MDIAGAKALKERLGSKAADRASTAPVEIPEDAPPLYHWTGIPRPPSRAFSDEPETAPGNDTRPSRFRRLLFSLR